jgi:hypothetical protein
MKEEKLLKGFAVKAQITKRTPLSSPLLRREASTYRHEAATRLREVDSPCGEHMVNNTMDIL